jgi:hypothetical protein
MYLLFLDLDRNGASKSRRNEIPLDLVHGTQMGPRRERINQSEHDSQIDHALNITSVNSASKLRRYSDPALSSLIAIIIQHQQFLLIRNQLQVYDYRPIFTYSVFFFPTTHRRGVHSASGVGVKIVNTQKT